MKTETDGDSARESASEWFKKEGKIKPHVACAQGYTVFRIGERLTSCACVRSSCAPVYIFIMSVLTVLRMYIYGL